MVGPVHDDLADDEIVRIPTLKMGMRHHETEKQKRSFENTEEGVGMLLKCSSRSDKGEKRDEKIG